MSKHHGKASTNATRQTLRLHNLRLRTVNSIFCALDLPQGDNHNRKVCKKNKKQKWYLAEWPKFCYTQYTFSRSFLKAFKMSSEHKSVHSSFVHPFLNWVENVQTVQFSSSLLLYFVISSDTILKKFHVFQNIYLFIDSYCVDIKNTW